MLNLSIVEDTFTPWADERLGTIDAFSVSLLQQLADIFLETIDEDDLVPELSGTLKGSAEDEDEWQFVSGLESHGLMITWSGKNNPNENEWLSFANAVKADYALANYQGFYLQTGGTQHRYHWVDRGINNTFVTGNGKEFAGKKYLAWLLTGK